MPGPPAEPVAAFVQASAAAIPAYSLRAPRFAAVLAPAPMANPASHVPAACGSWMPAPQPEPVATFVQTSAALAPALMRRLPRLAAELAIDRDCTGVI